MTRQEKIREELAIKIWLNFGENICPQCKSWKLCPHKQLYLDGADYLLCYLHSQGVVIKVDRELPQINVRGLSDKEAEWKIENWVTAMEGMILSGYVAVEPLIKEG